MAIYLVHITTKEDERIVHERPFVNVSDAVAWGKQEYPKALLVIALPRPLSGLADDLLNLQWAVNTAAVAQEYALYQAAESNESDEDKYA